MVRSNHRRSLPHELLLLLLLLIVVVVDRANEFRLLRWSSVLLDDGVLGGCWPIARLEKVFLWR